MIVRVGLAAPRDLEPVSIGHVVINQDDVDRGFRAEPGKGIITVGCDVDVELVPLKSLKMVLDDARVVGVAIHDQDCYGMLLHSGPAVNQYTVSRLQLQSSCAGHPGSSVENKSHSPLFN